jgi:hypothetical protein
LYSQHLIDFYLSLQAPKVPRGFAVLHPHPDKEVVEVVKKFFKKFYHDNHPRRLMLGINPGRLGAGITGINFTAPRQLKENCGIDHPWKNSSELSAEFIYKMIEAYGGPKVFYHDFFIGAVSPLGYTKGGINVNYYDDKKLALAVRPFIVDTIQQQLKMGFSREVCFCIGGEKNFKYLDALNREYHFFKKIVPLTHPRFIMQYRRKKLGEYVSNYVSLLKNGE